VKFVKKIKPKIGEKLLFNQTFGGHLLKALFHMFIKSREVPFWPEPSVA
jgi:hypothetical protein